MIDFYLSSDGKHTVHVFADTPEEMVRLLPRNGLYDTVVNSYGNKAQMWESVVNGKTNGAIKAGARPKWRTYCQSGSPLSDAQPANATAPRAIRPLWSCPARLANGHWCTVTRTRPRPKLRQKASKSSLLEGLG